MAVKQIALGLMLLGGLAGCGGLDKAKESPMLTAISQLSANAGRKARPSVLRYPRAEIEKPGKAVLYVGIPAWQVDSLMLPSPSRGPIRNWAGGDASVITQKDGILLQTRGLGPDLMSADVPSPAQILQGGPYRRVYYPVGPNEVNSPVALNCSSRKIGAENIELFGRVHATHRIVESCENATTKIQNDYWFEGPVVRKSREWVHPAIGNIDLARIID